MPEIMTEKNNSTRRRQILRQRTYHCHKKKSHTFTATVLSLPKVLHNKITLNLGYHP
jgi:acyl dehydratase